MRSSRIGPPNYSMLSREHSMYNYLYKIKNNINNKEYIGIHSTNNLDDNYMGSGILLKKAIKKYGIENFTKEIIQYFTTRDDALDAERLIVNESYVISAQTYNTAIGGNSPPLRKGSTLSNTTLTKLRNFRLTEEGKAASSKGGKNLWKTKNNWSDDSIVKRVNTRREHNSFKNDMSACHTADAIRKRTETRRKNGVQFNTSVCNSKENIIKRQKTRLINIINKILIHYNEQFTFELLKKARKEKVTYLTNKSLLTYFTLEDIRRLSCVEQLKE